MIPSLSLRDLTVAYRGRIALQVGALTLPQGVLCGLAGMNGAGKSTLFKALMGFVRPRSGEIEIYGRRIASAQKQQLIAYMPQTEAVDWQFPVAVEEVVMMGRYGRLNWLRRPRPEDREIVRQSLEQVDLLSYRERQIGELSGGQKKRVFLARALAQIATLDSAPQPSLLLLDEPFSGVDIRTEKMMIQRLLTLQKEGHTILISTHNLDSIKTFCDQVILINRTLLAYGETGAVFTPENLRLAFDRPERRESPQSWLSLERESLSWS
ncbi:MAG: ATP-binding cassette domain-containing protein [Cyanobacteria bacterium RI_101]|nr:ATP-binding cassette domain-containing protein [Cyanobacteria bacterium RI_101]